MNHLKKLARHVGSYREFEREVMAHLAWYEIPCKWTKVNLYSFWEQNKNGGK